MNVYVQFKKVGWSTNYQLINLKNSKYDISGGNRLSLSKEIFKYLIFKN